jgi:hypothetical protein
MEAMPRDLTGARNPARSVGSSFWAMITGAASMDGKLFDWVAVMPSPNLSASMDGTTLATNMWHFQEPYVAGFSNAREANDNTNVPQGAVVLLTFVGYAIAPTVPGPSGSTIVDGTANTPGGPTAAGADNSIAMYVFQFQSPDGQSSLPIHDHRDNFNGGFAFATYHPGTALPQQPWAI